MKDDAGCFFPDALNVLQEPAVVVLEPRPEETAEAVLAAQAGESAAEKAIAAPLFIP